MNLFNKRIVLIVAIVIIIVMYFVFDYCMFAIKQKNILSGNDIVKIFEKHQSKFIIVKEFVEKEEGSFNAIKSNRSADIIIKNDRIEYAIKEINASENLLFIMENLNFSSVYEYDTYIEFRKEEGNYPRGVIFLKSNTMMPQFVLNSKEIGDGWYYFSTNNV